MPPVKRRDGVTRPSVSNETRSCLYFRPPTACVGICPDVYRRLHEQFPTAKVVVGLWTFSGDRGRIARRIGVSPGNVASTLDEAIQEIRAATETCRCEKIQSNPCKCKAYVLEAGRRTRSAKTSAPIQKLTSQ